jgi:hypothetical protein
VRVAASWGQRVQSRAWWKTALSASRRSCFEGGTMQA